LSKSNIIILKKNPNKISHTPPQNLKKGAKTISFEG
jgi:hypothetical protein